MSAISTKLTNLNSMRNIFLKYVTISTFNTKGTGKMLKMYLCDSNQALHHEDVWGY
jgi:hypothetical protein